MSDQDPRPPTRILVCVKCRASGEPYDPPQARCGAQLHDRLIAASANLTDVKIEPIECFSVCNRPTTVGFSAPGKWTYLYGDFSPENPQAVLEVARLYGASPDGKIPVADRPSWLKAARIARTPGAG